MHLIFDKNRGPWFPPRMPTHNDIQEEIRRLELRAAMLDRQGACQEDFLTYVKTMWPTFVEGSHHRIIGKLFNRIASGETKRVIINMAPRHTKSEFSSVYLPSWFMGRFPDKKIIQSTHTTDLAVNFGRQVKNLIDRDDYKEIFPDTSLAPDAKASGRWATSAGGMYFAVGVGSNIAGKGADLFIIDDPHSEQTLLSANGFEDAMEWYEAGPRQRLQPGAAIVIVMTRWSEKDMTGQLIKRQISNPKADQWEIVELPAILPSGEPVWPEYWSKEALEAVKESIGPSKWNAQYMQKPTGDTNAIIKREYWQPWESEEIPDLMYVLQSWDTAFSAKEDADFSACTTWGVFRPQGQSGRQAIILLDAKKGRWDFPELKEKAKEFDTYWEPDLVLIEAKATGTPLTQELRQVGIPVVNFTPGKGMDKVARGHTISPIFESGLVYYPEGKRFAEDVIEECAAFPNGDNDDYYDTVTQAMMRYRQGNFVSLPSDDDDWVGHGSQEIRTRGYYG